MFIERKISLLPYDNLYRTAPLQRQILQIHFPYLHEWSFFLLISNKRNSTSFFHDCLKKWIHAKNIIGVGIVVVQLAIQNICMWLIVMKNYSQMLKSRSLIITTVATCTIEWFLSTRSFSEHFIWLPCLQKRC